LLEVNVRGFAMNVLIAIALASLGQPTEGKAELNRIKTLAIESTRAAYESVARAKGSGVFEHKDFKLVDGQLRDERNERGTFSMAFSGPRYFVKFQVESPGAEHKARIFVNDGGAILNSLFSPRIIPYGAAGYIYRECPEGGEPAWFGVAPNYFVKAWAFLDQVDKLHKGAPLTIERENGLYVIRVTISAQGAMEKFFIDPGSGYHVTRYELLKSNGKARICARKRWEKTGDGLWYVRNYVEERSPAGRDPRGSLWKFEFTSFEPNVEIPGELFTVDALGMPAGSAIIDQRVSPHETIIIKPRETDLSALEKIVGEMPGATVDVAPGRGNWRRLAVFLTIGFGLLLLIVGIMLRRRVASRKETQGT
jgi:hypothetical protein